MRALAYKNNKYGFAAVEALLVLVIIAAVVGVGAYVVRQGHNSAKTLSSNSTSTNSKPSGTTASVAQLAQQDATTENAVNSSADSSIQQDATSSNSTVNSVGGAYNENNY